MTGGPFYPGQYLCRKRGKRTRVPLPALFSDGGNFPVGQLKNRYGCGMMIVRSGRRRRLPEIKSFQQLRRSIHGKKG